MIVGLAPNPQRNITLTNAIDRNEMFFNVLMYRLVPKIFKQIKHKVHYKTAAVLLCNPNHVSPLSADCKNQKRTVRSDA